MKSDEIYQTSDLALAATLALSYPTKAVEVVDTSGKVVFVFKKTAGLEEMISKYWDKKIKVETQVYFSQIRNLKARIFAERKI